MVISDVDRIVYLEILLNSKDLLLCHFSVPIHGYIYVYNQNIIYKMVEHQRKEFILEIYVALVFHSYEKKQVRFSISTIFLKKCLYVPKHQRQLFTVLNLKTLSLTERSRTTVEKMFTL